MAAGHVALEEGTMGFYRDHILPKLLDGAMKNRMLQPYRQRVVGSAEGRVL